MLIGNNSIEMNEATMMLVVQYYFDNKLLNKDERKPKVTAVKPTSNGGYNNGFKIDFEAAVD